ncbi:unnamed protein product [Rotaria magnacalcarata]|uniref:PH domain-containing protein n=3 Tax=Rotaria magnacalcarata TaxID=392030 RepID=A0A816KJ49_9BILA|nr:unnamed protein product [Rotaria magnacalcarata]
MDHSLNSFSSLCSLLEKNGVKVLPAEVSGVSYRNADAALSFLQNVSLFLHEELIEKISKSWMMDESMSRTTQKSLIVYVRYLDNYEPKTSYYCLLDLDGDGTAQNIVDSISWMWRKDDIDPRKTCWFASDNASTFTGVHNGVVEKLRQKFDAEWIQGSPCAAHTFALVGSQAAYTLTDDNKLGPISPSVSKLESSISKIYNYFSRSSSRQAKLKNWQRFLEQQELRFKRLFDIRWSCIRDSIRPIIENIQPGSQALFIVLEEISSDWTCSNADRESARELRKQLLCDDLLFLIHFHHDLHECVLGPVTKLLQNDDFSYLELMKLINEKKNMLQKWIEQQPPVWGPSLSNYIEASKKNLYGLFKIEPADRKKLSQECFDHIGRLLRELDRRFKKCPLRENLSILFDPNYLKDHKDIVDQPTYGRSELNYVREKYKNLPSFDATAVQAEWELIKIPLAEYLKTSVGQTRKYFWKSFILLKESVNEQFAEQFKNILMLLSVYLLSASNSAECERGFSAANHVQTNGRSRLMIETLDVLLNVRLLLPDDVRSERCQFVASKAFDSWNDYEYKRRYNRTKLLIDIEDDYEPATQKRRPVQKRKIIPSDSNKIQQKKKKTTAIKCANRCGRVIASDDPQQVNAIQCCHQNEFYEWKHPLIDRQTHLVCQGELKNNRGQKLYVFLFDEILLFTRIATRNGFKSYQLINYPILVESLHIEDIEDGVKIPELSSGSFSRTLSGSKPARNMFRCSSLATSDTNNNRTTSILLQARDMYDKQQWLSAFRSIMIMK